MTTGSRGAVYQNLRVVNLECDFLRIDDLLRFKGRTLGTADLVNTAGFITLKDLRQPDWAVTDVTSQSYIANRPSLKSVALSGDYNDLVNRPSLKSVALSADYNDLVNRPALPAANVDLGGAAFSTFTCTGPLKVGPAAGLGNASVARGVQLYTSEGYDQPSASHPIGDSRVSLVDSDNLVGYCKVFVKNLSAPSPKTGFLAFLWMKFGGQAASSLSTVVSSRSPGLTALSVALVDDRPVISTDPDCVVSWTIEAGA